MRKLVTKFTWLFVIAFVAMSCSSKPSLQKFFVDNQNNDNFIVIDIPSSTLLNFSDDITEDEKKTIQSFRKINVLALQNDENKNEALYDSSKKSLKEIFKDENKYKPLIQTTSKKGSFDVYFEGTDKNIDEVIVFGYEKNMGLLVARVIGDDMNLGKITKVINKIKPNEDGMNSLGNLLKQNIDLDKIK
ncbi:DUF4252 domain-containing protein [Aureivirga sp. CE67]|uniref:DUF4252 domain-containing protein n=1 Tax=Aureivirga sp. CE67 TaxID=1788983 RepID=UPI0018CAB65E|nr:DUF4252 domain-containing protein [Aureivirga sp. CE67]